MVGFEKYLPQRIFLIHGDEDVFEGVLKEIAKENPFAEAMSVPRFTIEHARTVSEYAIEGTGQERTFIVCFSAFSPEAAQVLLKSLEEPDEKTKIIFVTRYPYLVPQTVRSRMMLLKFSNDHEEENKKWILEEIKKAALEKEDDAATRRGIALDLLDQLERSISNDPSSAKAVFEAKQMLFFANMPTKYVLDYVATVIR